MPPGFGVASPAFVLPLLDDELEAAGGVAALATSGVFSCSAFSAVASFFFEPGMGFAETSKVFFVAAGVREAFVLLLSTTSLVGSAARSVLMLTLEETAGVASFFAGSFSDFADATLSSANRPSSSDLALVALLVLVVGTSAGRAPV